MKRFLTSEELAQQLRVSVETIRAGARQGRIPCVRISQRPLLFDADEVASFLQRQSGGPTTPTEQCRDA